MKVTEVKAYQCNAEQENPKGSVCGRVYLDKNLAENCCKPYYCRICGVETRRYFMICDECKNKVRFEQAEKLTDWDGWGYWDEYGYDEGFFYGIDEIEEYCKDNDIPMPEWVFVCEEIRHELDIDAAIERMTEDAYEDAIDDIDIGDIEELREFVKRWNEKQNIVSCHPNFRKVLIIGDRLNEAEKE